MYYYNMQSVCLIQRHTHRTQRKLVHKCMHVLGSCCKFTKRNKESCDLRHHLKWYKTTIVFLVWWARPLSFLASTKERGASSSPDYSPPHPSLPSRGPRVNWQISNSCSAQNCVVYMSTVVAGDLAIHGIAGRSSDKGTSLSQACLP